MDEKELESLLERAARAVGNLRDKLYELHEAVEEAEHVLDRLSCAIFTLEGTGGTLEDFEEAGRNIATTALRGAARLGHNRKETKEIFLEVLLINRTANLERGYWSEEQYEAYRKGVFDVASEAGYELTEEGQ